MHAATRRSLFSWPAALLPAALLAAMLSGAAGGGGAGGAVAGPTTEIQVASGP